MKCECNCGDADAMPHHGVRFPFTHSFPIIRLGFAFPAKILVVRDFWDVQMSVFG